MITVITTITGGSCNKYHFCCDKSFVVTNTCLLWQKYTCCDKTFVQTKLCLSWPFVLVVTKALSWQKTCFVVTNVCLSGQKYLKNWSWEACFCHDKNMFCRNKHMFCHDKHVLFPTKMITCSSSCQWYTTNTTSTTSNINMHLPDSWRLTWE